MPTEQLVPAHDLPEQAVPAADLPDSVPKPAPDSALVHGLKHVGAQINPITGIEGLAHAIAHPIDTFNADAQQREGIASQAKADFGQGNYADGVVRVLNALVPFLGPQVQKAAETIASGDVSGGVGDAVGMGLNLATPTLLKNANIKIPAPASLGEKAADLYQSALKPSTRLAPGRVAQVVQTGLENAIPVSESGTEKLSGLIDDFNQKRTAAIQQAGPDVRVGTGKSFQNLADLKKKFSQQVNPAADLGAIDAAGSEFADSVPPSGTISAADAQALKTGTYRQLKSKSYGELKSASVEAQKALARGLKDELVEQFPELKDLNAGEAKLLDLEPVLTKAVSRIGNRELVGIGTPMVGAAVGAATGSGGMSTVAGMMKAIIDNPSVKSRLASALYKASKGGVTIPLAKARIQGYVNSLGQSVEGESSEQPDLQANQ